MCVCVCVCVCVCECVFVCVCQRCLTAWSYSLIFSLESENNEEEGLREDREVPKDGVMYSCQTKQPVEVSGVHYKIATALSYIPFISE